VTKCGYGRSILARKSEPILADLGFSNHVATTRGFVGSRYAVYETYTLAADGTMLVIIVRPEHKPINLLFQRK
jgi:hypothetical protein